VGPSLIFDKSAFQGLSLDQSVWLDALYLPNITPLFFVETLADLSLTNARAPEDIVRDLARKTPDMSAAVNGHHRALAIASLHNNDITMDGRPVVLSATPAQSQRGHVGWHLDVSPEQRAFQRWQRGAFQQVERDYANRWRSELSGIDLSAMHAKYRPIVLAASPRPRDLRDVKALAEQLCLDPRPLGLPDPLLLAFSVIGVPLDRWGKLSRFWRSRGEPPLHEFAPYAWHVVRIDLFFGLAIGAELIGRERQSNKVDVGYLYYLPFCNVFSSRDRLHRRVAPLFLRVDQEFIDGDDLKTDLRHLDEHYMRLTDEEKARGVIRFASRPPVDGDFLTTRLWDKFLPAWRELRDRPTTRSTEDSRAMVADINSIKPVVDGSIRPASIDSDGAFLKIIRYYPVHKGKWRILAESDIPRGDSSAS
jgi:hypothetical protein